MTKKNEKELSYKQFLQSEPKSLWNSGIAQKNGLSYTIFRLDCESGLMNIIWRHTSLKTERSPNKWQVYL